jgi:Cu-processing system permease protein
LFSTFTIARLTITEAMRRRILLAAFILGVAFLVLYGIGYQIMRNEMRPGQPAPVANIMRASFASFLTLAGLYAVNFLTIAMGALVSADTLAGEIGSGTIQVLATKPLRRIEIVLGKWIGFAGLLALYQVLMIGGVMLIAYMIGEHVVPNIFAGIGLMYLTALLMMTLTLASSSTLSTLATGGIVFGLYGIAFIGGWVEQFGAFLQNQGAVNIGIISSLIIPCEALWRRAVFEMSPAYTQSGFLVTPFTSSSVPSEAMIWYAVIYLALILGFAMLKFSRRDL